MRAQDIITPDMIETEKGHWYSSFTSNEREVSAKLFIRACKKVKGWTVTQEQLDKEDAKGHYWHNGLLGDKYIVEDGEGIFTATHLFIAHCFGKFPAKN